MQIFTVASYTQLCPSNLLFGTNYTNVLNRGIETDTILSLSCLSRSPGVMAHWRESMSKSTQDYSHYDKQS